MAQLEYGDYYKFIASAGIALIAGALDAAGAANAPFDTAIGRTEDYRCRGDFGHHGVATGQRQRFYAAIG